ncbi:MAG: CBS domain-containing protein [Solirubrobacteraceae bacterium]
MSPRAACRLATIGFTHIYDYVAGKSDWLARGLPTEGEKANEPRAIDFAGRDVVTCALTDRVDDVHSQIEASPFGFALVISDGGVLLGRLRRSALDGRGEQAAAEVMEPGPSTTRPDLAPSELYQRLSRSDLRTAILSDPDGRLLGVVRRDDLR